MPIQVFGAGAIQTAYVSYEGIDLTEGSVVLQWPDAYVNVPPNNILAASLRVNTGVANVNTLTLPDATMQSVGGNFIIINVGESSFNLLTSDGAQLLTVPSSPDPTSGVSQPMVGGSVTIPTSVVQSNSVIQLSMGIPGGTLGRWEVLSINPGISFTVVSNSSAETSTVQWGIMPRTWTSGVSTLSTGHVSVLTPSVTTDSTILVTYEELDNPGILSVPSGSIIPGVGFTIESTNNLDSSNVVWTIVQLVPTLTQGTATLTSGVAIVNTSAVTGSSIILLTYNTTADVGSYIVTTNIIPGQSFTIRSESTLDISSVNWAILPLSSILSSSNAYWVQLIDNSTPAGIWQYVQFGAGVSSAQASLLAGYGLTSIGTTLDTNIITASITSNYTVLPSDRASLLVWTTGTGTITLPLITSVPAGFYVSFNNGTPSTSPGILTVSKNGGDSSKIDNKTSIQIISEQSFSVISDGTNWWSLGLGVPSTSTNFIPGSAANPSITFITDTTTGIFYNAAPYLGFTVSGVLAATIANVPLTNTTEITIGNSVTPDLAFVIDPTNTTIYYNGNTSIIINSDGSVNLPPLTPVLPITSGGTGASTQPTALNALMPPTPADGDLLYFNGTNWVLLPIGSPTIGQKLTVTGTGPIAFGWT
jgi:hypothetical protein